MQVMIKILAYKRPQRYAVHRTVTAAIEAVCASIPDLIVPVEEVTDREAIESYTPVIIYPSIVMDDNLVCTGRFPKKDEIVAWLRQAVEKNRLPFSFKS